MKEKKKTEELKNLLNKFKSYKINLTDENLQEFYNLKKEFLNLLTDNEKIRFNQINFYEIIPDYNSEPNDLPF
jgi:flagellar biosynthesis/type III secretory pathway chaperone